MALNRIQFPRSLPLAESDYDQKNTLIDVLKNNLDADLILSSGSIAAGFSFVLGGTVYQADSDTAVSGSATDYIKITASGATATAEYVADLGSAEWNYAYKGYYDDDEALYIVDEDVAFLDGEITEGHERYVEKNGDGEYTGKLAGIIVGTSEDIEAASIFIGPSNVSDGIFTTATYESPAGIAYDQNTGNIIVLDGYLGGVSPPPKTNKIYIHDGFTNTILDSFNSPNTGPSSIAIDTSTGNLLSIDNIVNTIYVHDGISSSILDSFSAPTGTPLGIAYDHITGNMLSSGIDGGTQNIYVHDGISSTVLNTYTYTNARNMMVDVNGNLIVVNASSTIKVFDGISNTELSSISFNANAIAYYSAENKYIVCRDDALPGSIDGTIVYKLNRSLHSL